MLKKRTLLLAGTMVAVSPVIAMAHPGHGGSGGFSHGVLHPLTGLDHMLAIIAVALLAVRQGGRSLWAVPAAFITCGAIGGAIAWSGTTLPMVEITVLASLLLCAGLLIRQQSAPTFALVMLALFGGAHGFAHVSEMGSAMSLGSYSAGLLLSSVALSALAIGVGSAVKRFGSVDALGTICRVAGTGLAAAAVVMLSL